MDAAKSTNGLVALVAIVIIASILIGTMSGFLGLLEHEVETSPGQLSNVSEASYIIYKDGDYSALKNATTGRVEIRNINSSYVIQSAIDALEGIGGKIFIRTGYYENVSLVIDGHHNIIIEGEGWDSPYPYDYLGTVFRCEAVTEIVNITDSTNIIFRTIGFDGTDNVPASDFAYSYGVKAYDSSRITLDNCKFHLLRYGAVYAYHVYGLKIVDSMISGCGSSTVFDATITNYPAVEVTGSFSPFEPSTDFDVMDSYVIYSPYIGIRARYCNDPTYINNVYFESRNTTLGVWETQESHIYVTSNSIIENNFFYGTGKYMIEVENGPHTIIGNQIMGQSSGGSTSTKGISCAASSAHSVVISGNYISTLKSFAIKTDGNRHTISNNVISSIGDTGIILIGKNQTVVGNEIRNCGMSPSYALYGDGVLLNSAQDCVISNNRIHDDQAVKTTQRAIREIGTANYNSITDNDVRGNVGGIIRVGTSTLVESNIGQLTEVRFTSTILSGTTFREFYHGLGVIPALVIVTGGHAETAQAYITNCTTTHLTVNVPSATSGDRTVYVVVYAYSQAV